MDILLVLGLIFCGILALLALFTRHYTAFWYKIFVTDKLETVNMLLDTEDVPLHWRIKPLEWLIRRDRAHKAHRFLNNMLVKWYLHRLKNVSRYVRRCSVIKAEDKPDFVSALAEIGEDWAGGGISI
jgi:hypothetical protein